MQLARVIGTVVATIKNDSLQNRKLLVIQSLNKNLAPQGKPMVAVDAAGAGVGELVSVHVIPRPHGSVDEAMPVTAQARA